MFTRTPTGLSEKWRFCVEPIVWVEGPSDIAFYRPISHGVSCRFEPFFGRENASHLIRSLLERDYPYVVILDGDYSILKKSRAPHRSVLILPRYSFENLLWESGAVNDVCLQHAQCGEDKDLVSHLMILTERAIRNELLGAIVADIAARWCESSPKVLPDHIDEILANSTGTDLDRSRIATRVESARSTIDKRFLRRSEDLVESFLRNRRVTDLLKGHLLFGILRRILIEAAARERGSRKRLSNDIVVLMLSAAVWKYCKGGDHRRLKRNFRSKLRHVATQRRSIDQEG